MKNIRGISLIVLAIAIILLLLLAGATVGILKNSGILKNAEYAVDLSKVQNTKTEIKHAIVQKMTSIDKEITLEQIVEQLEKNNIIDKGESNLETGQVKTNKNGYIYEIKEKTNRRLGSNIYRQW